MSLSEDSSSNHSKEDIESAKLTGNKYNRIFYRDELDKILDDPRTDDHKDILEWIEKEKLCLYSKEGDKDKGDSLIKILLEEVGNGHEVVERVLDSYMRTPSANINSNTFKVKMDFTGLMLDGEDKIDSGLMSLFRKKSGSGDSILHDIVELKLKYQEYFWDHYTNGFKGKKENCSKSFIGKFQSSNIIKITSIFFSGLLAHPVLACFIALKWKKVWRYFLAHTILFFLFLVSYYTYIIRIFMADHQIQQNQTDSRFNDKNDTLPFFLEELPAAWWSWVELLFFIFTLLLIISELYQMCRSGISNYFKDTENWIQIFVFLTAILAMVWRKYILTHSQFGDYVRGVISLGIGAAWFEFLLVVGRYPFRGGDFSIMFYRVLRKLFRYVMALFMIVAGFSCSFIVISYGTNNIGFDRPLKSFAMTLTMAMGEFNSKDLYGNFTKKEYEDEKVSRTFAMFLLIALILAGTITMVNLFITVIITSKDKLKQSVLEENLFYMAQCSEMIQDFALRFSKENFKIKESATFCVHKICGSKCKTDKVPNNIHAIEEKLRDKAEKLAAEKERKCKKTQTVL